MHSHNVRTYLSRRRSHVVEHVSAAMAARPMPYVDASFAPPRIVARFAEAFGDFLRQFHVLRLGSFLIDRSPTDSRTDHIRGLAVFRRSGRGRRSCTGRYSTTFSPTTISQRTTRTGALRSFFDVGSPASGSRRRSMPTSASRTFRSAGASAVPTARPTRPRPRDPVQQRAELPQLLYPSGEGRGR